MKLIIDAKAIANIGQENGSITIEVRDGTELPFKIASNDGRVLCDDGWLKVTRNNTLTINRIK